MEMSEGNHSDNELFCPNEQETEKNKVSHRSRQFDEVDKFMTASSILS